MTSTTTIVLNTLAAASLEVGILVRSPHPNSNGVLRIVGIRILAGEGKTKLLLQKQPKCDIPEGAIIVPWPRLPRGRPAAQPQHKPEPVESQAKKVRAQRMHVINLLHDDRDSDRLVASIRISNETALNDEWRDPDDLNANRRTPKMVSGYRSFDVVSFMVKNNAITSRQGRAARRLRDQHDRGVEGLRPGYDRLQQAPGSFGSGSGISEERSAALEEFNQAKAAIGPSLWQVVEFVIIGNHKLAEYAARKKQHHYKCAERLSSSLDRLGDHYAEQSESFNRETK